MISHQELKKIKNDVIYGINRLNASKEEAELKLQKYEGYIKNALSILSNIISKNEELIDKESVEKYYILLSVIKRHTNIDLGAKKYLKFELPIKMPDKKLYQKNTNPEEWIKLRDFYMGNSKNLNELIEKHPKADMAVNLNALIMDANGATAKEISRSLFIPTRNVNSKVCLTLWSLRSFYYEKAEKANGSL